MTLKSQTITKARSAKKHLSDASIEPPHPGETLLEDFMKPLGLTASALALELHVTPARIGEIVRGKRAITAETALRLSRYFGTTPRFWLGLQSLYDLRTAERALAARIRREVRPREGSAKAS